MLFSEPDAQSGVLDGVVALYAQLLSMVLSTYAADATVTRLDTCGIAAVSFRTASDGWMSDRCGKVFRSSDGTSWRSDPEAALRLVGKRRQQDVLHVQRWWWLDDRVGLAWVDGKQQVFRTEDGGAAWEAIELPYPEPEMVYAIESVGARVWFCGSSGRVTRSEDFGRSWKSGEPLFEPAAVNPSDWCTALSFLDPEDGWVAGWKTVYATKDGGKTWSARPPVLEPVPQRPRSHNVKGLVRLTPRRAWARTEGEAFYFTDDAGASWERREVPKFEPTLARRPDGRGVVLRVPAPRLEDGIPMADDAWVPRGETSVANRHVTVFENGALLRRGPPVTPGTGELLPLVGTRKYEKTTWGWAGTYVFRSDDEARSWYRVGIVDEVIERLEPASLHTLLVRAGGRLIASDDEGRSWKDLTKINHRADWKRLTGEDLELRPWEVIHCAMVGPSTLDIRFGSQGCYHFDESTLKLELSSDSGRVSGTWHEWDPRERVTVVNHARRQTTADELRTLIRSIADAATQPERDPNCWSTTTTFVRLKWTCGGAPASEIYFTGHDCGDDDDRAGRVIHEALRALR